MIEKWFSPGLLILPILKCHKDKIFFDK